MSNFTIANGCNVPINVRTGRIPDVSGGLTSWFQPMIFTKIVKATVAFQLIETATNINFWGVLQPLNGRELAIKPEGERRWNWVSVYAQDDSFGSLLSLQPDEVISYLGTQYRVMSSKNYSNYGFSYLELVEDYTGSGPN